MGNSGLGRKYRIRNSGEMSYKMESSRWREAKFTTNFLRASMTRVQDISIFDSISSCLSLSASSEVIRKRF